MIQSPDDPIAALATPAAPSALAVIRVSGNGCLPLLTPLVRGGFVPASAAGHTLHRCTVMDGGEAVDDVVLAVYRAPRSYTGEDGAEIFCHGSLPVIRRLLSLLDRSGFRPAGPGEFTQRAFLNGRMSLTQAEAVDEIVRSRTDRARALALQRLGGAIEERVQHARDVLVDLRASIEVLIDYPEESEDARSGEVGPVINPELLDHAHEVLESLVDSYRQGRAFQEGVTVALAGATNSGKSRLFNRLLQQERAIVSDVHGTTRDWIESSVNMEGVPVRLLDTAGLRVSADPLESEGIRRTREVIAGADVVVYLVDGTRGLSAEDCRLLKEPGSAVPPLRAWNKADHPECGAAPDGFLRLSAATGEGLELLQRAIVDAALGGPAREGSQPLVDSERQRNLLLRALEGLERFRAGFAQGAAPDLLALDLAECLEALGEISGAVTSAEVLDRMFSRFCVGK